MEDKNLKQIRHYKADWKNFSDYRKERDVEIDPYKGKTMLYPKKKIQTRSTLPYQDFGTYNKSKNNRLIESFAEFIKSLL